jgi:hypothetical protein
MYNSIECVKCVKKKIDNMLSNNIVLQLMRPCYQLIILCYQLITPIYELKTLCFQLITK